MLTQHELVPYLLSRDLIASRCVVNGDVVVLDSSRRHCNYRIISPDGCYLVKQAVGSGRIETLSHEATLYRQLFSGAQKNDIARHLPRFYGYDPEQHILILELIQDAENLHEQQQRLGRVSPHTSKQIAGVLAALHRTKLHQQGVTTARASVLGLHIPSLVIYRSISRAVLQLIEIIQKHETLTNHLDQLRQEWQPSGFIHGDIRAENFLIPVPLARSKRPLKIVDLEFAGVGDIAWDVGSVFAEYLSFWLFSFPLTTASSLDRFIHLAACPLEKVQPPLRSFWNQYARCMALRNSNFDQFLVRAVKFSALRLIVSGFETSASLSTVNAHILSLVQVAMNILLQPQDAAVELFGIALCHD